MKISQEGINLIKRFEGCVLKIYLDAVGVPSAGYGHTAGLAKSMVGQPIKQSQADLWLKQDLEKFEKKVMKYNNVYLWTQQEFDSLVSFAFNVGSIDGLTAKGTRAKPQIAECMLSYNKAGGKVLKGLTKRRQAERDLFLKYTPQKQYPTLKRGMSGNAVKEMQKLLGIKEDGLFGIATETAVKIFQQEHGLQPDGVVGKLTWAELLK